MMAVAGSGSPPARRPRAGRARVSAAAVATAAGDQRADEPERPGQDRLAWLDIPRSGKISETIARDILDDIVVRNLPPGTMLASEAVMLDRYGVGRASLREALRILEIHGLIKIKPGPRGGPVVAEVTSSDLGRSATFYFHAVGATFADLLGARLAIEPMMARLAATNLTAEAAEELKRTLVEHERDATRPASSWSRTSAGFHHVVNGLSGNKVLDMLCRALLDIHTERAQTEFPVSGRGDVSRAHQRIAQAILDGDADAAEQRMRRHVQAQIANVRQTRPDMLDELIDWR
jgi:DNA-binding FadR family transcriptional regulator